MVVKSYPELIQIPTFEERVKYLQIFGRVGEDTFGFDRIFNQMFYNSKEWKHCRNDIIIRDNGCDLGIKGYEISDGVPIYIHHMNPISINDIESQSEWLMNPEFLITTIFSTHSIIHYGNKKTFSQGLIERKRNDTCPWRQ